MVAGGCASNNASTRSDVQGIPPVASQNAITPKGATNFTSKTAGFSIYFPVEPTEKRISSTSKWGDYERFTYQSETEPVTYMVLATTIPPAVDTSNPREFIEDVQTGMVQEASAKVQTSRNITLDGIPGREVQTSIMNGVALSRAYIYFTPTISYQIMAVGLKKEFESQQPQIEKVLSSFRLTDK
jgi:hypothetical protein